MVMSRKECEYVFNKTPKQTVMERCRDPISMTFVAANESTLHTNLHELDPCFMYTEILKEILLTIAFEEDHVKQFIHRCQEQFVSDKTELESIIRIEKEYHRSTPLKSYTSSGSLCSLVNRALRTMDVGLIIKLGFFIRDLVQNIEQLHAEQSAEFQRAGPFKVFRGQSLSRKDLDQLVASKGGLLSFNNFLSTSRNRQIAGFFADGISPDLTPILFEITINPSISKVSFVDLGDISTYQSEEEILFSMHSVFRIGEVEENQSNGLWHVNLTLTGEDDPQLRALTDFIRQETHPEKKGWYRIVEVLYKVGQYDKAQQVCEAMLDQTTDDCEIANVHHLLGMIMDNQHRYEEAVTFYERSVEINERILSSTHIDVGGSYSNLGIVYTKMKKYEKAFECYEKALNICQTTTPENLSKLAICYNNIGLLHEERANYDRALSMDEKISHYKKALSMYENALQLHQKVFPENHPNLAICYGNMGKVQSQIGNHTDALSSHEKAIQICQRSLPSDHQHLAISYHNIALVYEKIDDHSNTRAFYMKALEIDQKTLPSNHPQLADCCSKIARSYYNSEEYHSAFDYIKRAVDIAESLYQADHPCRVEYNAGLKIIRAKLSD